MTSEPGYAGKSAYRGDVAANYERDRAHEPIWQREQAWMTAWAECIPAGARVLDLPAGTGRFTGILRARGAQVHCVDVSDDMLAEVRRRWPPDGDALVVERGDAEALAYPAGTFDFVVCWRLMHLLPATAAERVVRELARVCRGQIVLEVLGVRQGGALRQALGVMGRWMRGWLPARGTGAPAEVPPWAHITNYPHAESTLRALFARCGLRLVRAETLTEYAGAPARVYFLEHGGSRS